LTLRTYWRGGDHQNGNNQPQVHEYLLGYATCDMIPNPKKVTKIKKHLAAAGDGAMWSTLFAFTFLIAVALSLAAIRLNV
jgi:hypothetical protein